MTRTAISPRRRGRAVLSAVVGLPAWLGAQSPIELRLKPRVGDTIQVYIEQMLTVEVADSAGASPRVRSRERTAAWTRLVVEATDATGATVLVVTDSVKNENLAGPVMRKPMMPFSTGRARVRIDNDGAAHLSGGAVRSRFGDDLALPPIFPTGPTAVHAEWTQALGSALSIGTLRGEPARFRLDSASLSRAWISVRIPESSTRQAVSEQMMEQTGELTGFVVLDRLRGWITESLMRAAMLTRLTAGGRSQDMRTTVEQHIRFDPPARPRRD